MDDINKIIGKNLSVLRKQKKLTQMELADKLNYSDKSISKWETGESLPSIEVLYDLANFYNVSLDSLTCPDGIIIEQKKETKKKEKLIPFRLVITLLAVCAVWVLATSLYVSFKLSLNKNFYIFFIWAIPLSCIVLTIFNSIWGKSKYLFPILSVLNWTTITAFYVQFINNNLWPLFILAVPIQVVILVAAGLVAPKRKPKNQLTRQPNQTDKTDKQPATEQLTTPKIDNAEIDNAPVQQESTDITTKSQNKIEVTFK